jgi:outer membrane protein OmpA-like peptidoglycan-associated protein/outer membrane protein W
MRHIIAIFGAALVTTIGTTAAAQERNEPYLAQHVRAPSDALELRIGTGYTQGFGNVAPGRSISNMSGAGVGVGVDVDYRLSRPWSIGLEAQYQELSAEQNSSARGLAANLGVTYHFDPVLRGDPWMRLGTGYRLLWENDPVESAAGTTLLRHGFELLALKIGYDVRVSEDVAIAPVVGADLDMFVWQDSSPGGSSPMATAQVGSFVYAGLQGRFDMGGERGGVQEPVARQPAPEPKGVTAPQAESPIAPPPVQQTTPISPSLAASEDVIRACNLSVGSVEKAPKFAFDKSELLPADFDVLKQIGECFTTGPMKDLSLQLIGRADPRGTVAYNQALGMMRATQVATYLEKLGLDSSKIETTSRGKLDAVGTDETSWAIDRRVDVMQR